MPLRVLHCPDIVGGNPGGLAAAERELGLESWTVGLRPSPYGFAVDEVLWDEGDGPLARELERWGLVFRAMRHFDVVHFNFGSTIAPEWASGSTGRFSPWAIYSSVFEQLDLRLLARAGKAIFVTFQGDDARQGAVASSFAVNASVEAPPGYYTPRSDADKRRRIARFERYADGIYALNPDLLRVLPARTTFVPYAHLDPRTWQPGPPAGNRERPLVLHAPTNREIKGTRFVLDAVERLRAERISFDFRLVEGVSHSEVRSLYERADLVVDQLLIGWYGGLAVELMALGRPVIAYLRDEDLEVLPPDMRAEIPVIPAQPATIYAVLKELLTRRREELPEIGRRGREYVERWHDPLKIAAGVVADYERAVERCRA